MPRNTTDSQAIAGKQASAESSKSRHRQPGKHVSFEDEQAEAVRTRAVSAAENLRQSKGNTKIELRSNAVATRKVLKEGHYERDNTKLRMDRIARLEAEVQFLRRGDELEKHHLATEHRKEDQRMAEQRRARQTSKEITSRAEVVQELYSDGRVTIKRVERDRLILKSLIGSVVVTI